MQQTATHWHNLTQFFPDSERTRTLIAAEVLAVLWWAVALWLRGLDLIPIWYDQQTTFTQVGGALLTPYSVTNFVNPPWAAPLLLPFHLLPLEIAVLVQSCIYFAVVTLIVYRFGGDWRAVMVALTSFIGFDTVLELNVEWLVYVGLLVPPMWSGPLLVIKPQLAMGYWLSLSRRDLVRAIIVLLATLLVSFAIWTPFWLVDMLEATRSSILRYSVNSFNVAPMDFLTPWVSVPIGLVLSYRAFRKRDAALSILAWLFFVPYITLYSLLLPLALLAIKLRRLALIVNLVMWLVYGGMLVAVLLIR